MKKEEKSFSIVCDCCGEKFHDGNDFCSYCNDTDGSMIESEAESNGWLTIGDKHYCPDCYSHDDNDNIATNDGHVFDGDTLQELQGTRIR